MLQMLVQFAGTYLRECPGNLRIKKTLLIAKLHPQINSWLELNTEFVIN